MSELEPLRCYTTEQVCALLQVSRKTFERHRAELVATGVLVELWPRLGHPRYRTDKIDLYLAGKTPRPERAFLRSRRLRRVG